MQRLYSLRNAVATALLATLAIAASPGLAHAITGGDLDGDGHPNVGTFVLTNGSDEDLDGVPDWDPNQDGIPDVPATGGNLTLIHPRVAVGAAHVFEIVLDDLAAGKYLPEEVKVSFSSNPKRNPETWLDVSDVIIHPAYDRKFLPGWGAVPRVDVAVVILSEPAVGITPATLAPEGFLDLLEADGWLRTRNEGAPFTVLGYGRHGKAPNKLLPPDGQRRVAVSEFMLLDDQWLFLDQNEAHGNGGSQIADSGGPTFWVDPITGEEVLVALISNGDAAGVAVGINFRVDTAESLDFFDAVIAAVEAGEL